MTVRAVLAGMLPSVGTVEPQAPLLGHTALVSGRPATTGWSKWWVRRNIPWDRIQIRDVAWWPRTTFRAGQRSDGNSEASRETDRSCVHSRPVTEQSRQTQQN